MASGVGLAAIGLGTELGEGVALAVGWALGAHAARRQAETARATNRMPLEPTIRA